MTDFPFARLPNSHRFRSSILIGMIAVATSAHPVCARQLQHVQGTSVSLQPMPGFKPTSSFAGFMNPNQGSILVVEFPEAAYGQISRSFADIEAAKANFAKSNVIVEKLEEIGSAGGGRTPLLTGSQTGGDIRYDKWIALFKGPPTVMITVTSPHLNRLDGSQVRAMMQSVSIGRAASLTDKIAALPFTATPAPPFRILDSLAGATLSMTVGDKDVDPERTQPWLAIAYEPALVEDPAELERNPTPPRSLGHPRIESRQPVKFAGISGLLLNGRCDGERRFLQYMAVTRDHKLITMVYDAPEPGFDGLRPAVEAIAASVILKPD
jgi:hypothetical protein